MKALQESLQPDSFAIVIRIESAGAGQFSQTLGKLGGERIQQTLTDEMVEQICSKRESGDSEEEE